MKTWFQVRPEPQSCINYTDCDAGGFPTWEYGEQPYSTKKKAVKASKACVFDGCKSHVIVRYTSEDIEVIPVTPAPGA